MCLFFLRREAGVLMELREEPYPPDEEQPDPDRQPTHRAKAVRQAAMAHRPKRKIKRPQSGMAKQTQQRILAREKQRRAMEMRKAGATYQIIADQVGYADQSGARKAVERAMKETLQEPAEELRTMQIERLNHMLLTLWPGVQAGDTRSIDTSLRIMDKLDRLMGTEAPVNQQVDVNVNHAGAILVIDNDKAEYIRNLQKMAGYNPPAVGSGAPALGSGIIDVDPVDGDAGDSQGLGGVHPPRASGTEPAPIPVVDEEVVDAEVVDVVAAGDQQGTAGPSSATAGGVSQEDPRPPVEDGSVAPLASEGRTHVGGVDPGDTVGRQQAVAGEVGTAPAAEPAASTSTSRYRFSVDPDDDSDDDEEK